MAKAFASPECVPIPAGTMLGKMYSGNMSDVCSLCLCEDAKLLRSTNVYLKDDFTEGHYSLASLVRELQLDKIIAQNSLDRLCELCVQQLSSFYLFKSKCTKLASGLTNFYTFTETTKDNTTVVLPFETIQEYAVKDEKLDEEIPMEIQNVREKEQHDCCDNMSKLYPSTNKQYLNRDVARIKIALINNHQKDPLTCNANVNYKKPENARQNELNKYKTVAKCIVQGKSYCSCCLTENQELLELHETMLFMERQDEIIALKDILFGINCININECEPVLVCQDCLNVAVTAYNFKTMFHKSSIVTRNCVSCLESLVTNSVKFDLSPEVKRVNLNFYLYVNNLLKNSTASATVGKITSNPNNVEKDKSGVSVAVRSVKKSEDLTSACHICGQEFSSFDKVQPHISEKHKDLLYCSYCNKIFKSRDKSLLKQHIVKCRNIERPFECDICNMKFIKLYDVNSHRLRHFPKTIKCEFCHLMLWSQRDLNQHIRNVHRDMLKDIECTICQTVFTTIAALTTHMLTHPPDSMHTCKYCGASYNDKVGYLAHCCPGKADANVKDNSENTKTAKNVASKSTICDICGLALKTAVNLKNHRKKHENKSTTDVGKSKSVMCDICGQLFKDMRGIKSHLKNNCETRRLTQYVQTRLYKCSKTGRTMKRLYKKFFECQPCNYKTVLKVCYELHMNKYHLKIKPYKCSLCEKSYHTLPMLKGHTKLHGRGPDNSLICNECGRLFKMKKCLMYHMRLHTGERPYPCDLCDAKFISASRRQDHRIRKHFEPTVECNICSKFYYNQRSLREHIRQCHSGGRRKKKKDQKNVDVDEKM